MNYIENNGLYYRHNHGGHHHNGDITTMEGTITMITTTIITEVDGAGVEAHGAVDFPWKFCGRCVRWAYSRCINGCSRWRILSSTVPSNLSSAISSFISNTISGVSTNTISVLNKKRLSSFLFNTVLL